MYDMESGLIKELRLFIYVWLSSPQPYTTQTKDLKRFKASLYLCMGKLSNQYKKAILQALKGAFCLT